MKNAAFQNLNDDTCLVTGKSTQTRHKYKNELSLEHHLLNYESGMIKLEALNDYGDTCLNTTVSELTKLFGIVFKRELEPHTHRSGGKTHFMRYWLADYEQAEKAIAAINYYRKKRGVEPVHLDDYLIVNPA